MFLYLCLVVVYVMLCPFVTRHRIPAAVLTRGFSTLSERRRYELFCTIQNFKTQIQNFFETAVWTD